MPALLVGVYCALLWKSETGEKRRQMGEKNRDSWQTIGWRSELRAPRGTLSGIVDPTPLPDEAGLEPVANQRVSRRYLRAAGAAGR